MSDISSASGKPSVSARPAALRKTIDITEAGGTEKHSVFMSDGESSVRLTLSREASYREVTYTAESIRAGGEKPPEAAGTPLMRTGMDDGVWQAGPAGLERHLHAIRHRVMNLLLAMVRGEQPQEPYSSGGDEGNEETGAVHGSARYTEQSIHVKETLSLEIDGAAPDMSPEATARRILGFALAHDDGGDRAAFADKVRAAVLKGYNEAKRALGGFLPPEASRTLELVMNGLDSYVIGEGR